MEGLSVVFFKVKLLWHCLRYFWLMFLSDDCLFVAKQKGLGVIMIDLEKYIMYIRVKKIMFGGSSKI